jgi:superfamily II DNA or RNA helicase
MRKGAQRALYQLPTGGGKTVVFSHILASAARRGKRVLVVCHRQEIFEQAKASLALADVEYGKIAPGCSETDAPVQIAMVATLAQLKRLERWAGKFDLIVIDEAHHAVAGCSPHWGRASRG